MAEDGLTISWILLLGEVLHELMGGKDFRWGVLAAVADGDSELALWINELKLRSSIDNIK